MKKSTFFLSLAIMVLLAAAGFLLKGALKKTRAQERFWTNTLQLEYANTLLSKGLKEKAAEAYKEYVAKNNTGKKDLASICYKLGNIYMDLGDYEGALASFYKAELLDKEAEYKQDMNGLIVEALENLGLSQQAQYELESRTSVGPVKKTSDNVVAKIGKREITQGEVDSFINNLSSHPALKTEAEKNNIIKDYVSREVLYENAKKLGIDRSPKFKETIANIKKDLMLQQFLGQEVEENLQITPDDLELYYKANKDKYTLKDKEGQKELSFEEAKPQVERDYRLKKQQEIIDTLFKKALESQEVSIYQPQLENADTKK